MHFRPKKHFLAERKNGRFSIIPARIGSVVHLGFFLQADTEISDLQLLGGNARAIKKITQNDNGLGPGQNYGETAVFTFGRKVVWGHSLPVTALALSARGLDNLILLGSSFHPQKHG